jgi:hypothetical protein
MSRVVLAYDIHNLLSVKIGHGHGERYVERWGRLIYVRPEEFDLHVKGSYYLNIHGSMESRDGVLLTLPTTAAGLGFSQRCTICSTWAVFCNKHIVQQETLHQKRS